MHRKQFRFSVNENVVLFNGKTMGCSFVEELRFLTGSDCRKRWKVIFSFSATRSCSQRPGCFFITSLQNRKIKWSSTSLCLQLLRLQFCKRKCERKPDAVRVKWRLFQKKKNRQHALFTPGSGHRSPDRIYCASQQKQQWKKMIWKIKLKICSSAAQKWKEKNMNAFRVKIRIENSCAGAAGPVREVPPDPPDGHDDEDVWPFGSQKTLASINMQLASWNLQHASWNLHPASWRKKMAHWTNG